jgi:predicted AAA+ superfamily ATPase
MILRPSYTKQLLAFKDKPFVKVINGLRRSGKSSILKMLQNDLVINGVLKENIIYINFESFNYAHITNALELYNYVKERINKKEKTYLFLDEIQEIKEWEKAINSFLVDFDTDIYITGSNSKLLSSELSSYLTGRYIAFHVQTLSFQEYLAFYKSFHHKEIELYEGFENYRRFGGFPALHIAEYDEDSAYKIVYDIYSSAILRDTVQRFNIRDIELLERVVKYLFDNVGNSFSAKKIADYFKSQQRKIDLNTVYNYLSALESAFIVYRIPRYDVKGKEILKTQEKYYLGDIALQYAVMGYRDRFIAGILENIVLLELKRRGYQVFVGKFGVKEIDFIAEKGNSKLYIQVTYLLAEKSTVEREFSSLIEIKDNYPKYVVSMDRNWSDNLGGIQHKHIADFLLLDSF